MEGETIEHVALTSKQIGGDGDRSRLETDLGSLQGVRDVNVKPDAQTAEIAFDPRVINLDKILEVMQSDGYDVESRQFAARRDNTAV